MSGGNRKRIISLDHHGIAGYHLVDIEEQTEQGPQPVQDSQQQVPLADQQQQIQRLNQPQVLQEKEAAPTPAKQRQLQPLGDDLQQNSVASLAPDNSLFTPTCFSAQAEDQIRYRFLFWTDVKKYFEQRHHQLRDVSPKVETLRLHTAVRNRLLKWYGKNGKSTFGNVNTNPFNLIIEGDFLRMRKDLQQRDKGTSSSNTPVIPRPALGFGGFLVLFDEKFETLSEESIAPEAPT